MLNESKFNVDRLSVSISPNRDLMGKACAEEAGNVICQLLEEKENISIIFASAPSQLDMLYAIMENKKIDWKRIIAFHMDEYIGLPADAPQSFGNYLRIRLFSKLPFKEVLYMDGNASDIESECNRYAELLRKYPPDISFIGIGENGHMAFNDPHIADFYDPKLVKVNPYLDDTCREQQVNDGWFKNIDEVPKSAITITIPGLLLAPYVFGTVPGVTKSKIVKECLEGPISLDCPASILRLHKCSKLFLDDDSAALLEFK